jgi:hypothetical protein
MNRVREIVSLMSENTIGCLNSKNTIGRVFFG